jgi:hypothetical protein
MRRPTKESGIQKQKWVRRWPFTLAIVEGPSPRNSNKLTPRQTTLDSLRGHSSSELWHIRQRFVDAFCLPSVGPH